MPKGLLVGISCLSTLATGCGGASNALPSTAVPGAGSSAAAAGAARTTPSALSVKRSTSAAPATAYAAAILASAPNAYYQLNDTSATLLDAGPNGVSGTYGSSVRRQSAAITAGATTAATFPGGASYNPAGYAYTPMSAVLQPAHPTLEAWFSLNAPNATSHDLPLVTYGSVGRGARYGLFIHGLGNGAQCLEIQQRNAGQTQLIAQTNTRLAVGQAYHVVVTSDGAHVTTYVNGVLDSTVAYAGSVDYTPYFTDGLQIGGADQGASWGSASFPGTIAQVAVYNSPLSQAQVVAHFLAGQIVPMVTETPADSDKFVDSIGVNAHFENPAGIYGTQFAPVANLLVASGIRHVRAGITYNFSTYPSEMKQLAAAGVFASYETSLGMTQAQIQQWPSIVGASFEQYEAPNEQDDVGNPNWLPACIAFQKSLYSWVKGDAAIAKYPVLGPAIVSMTDAQKLGNLSAYMDNGNIHDYFSVFNPGTIGWGSNYPGFGNYGSIPFNVNIGKVIDGSKPIEATETGYGTVAGNPLTLDYRAHLRYMTRMFFEQFNAGIVRSYSYELMDEGGSAVFNNFGLITTSMQPKPAYTGIKSIIGQLADPGAAFTTTPLTYQITGFVNGVTHTLLQKRNGHYVLAVWLEVPAWVSLNNAGGDITVAPQTITLATAKHFSAASIATMDENGNMTSAPLSWNGTSASISVTDKVSLIDLAP